MKCYHTTGKENLTYIANYGLNPNIGKNSRMVKEREPRIYFTNDLKFINTWKKRLEINEIDSVVLNFNIDKYLQSYDEAGDYFSKELILPEDIYVIVDNEQIPLKEYYKLHKKECDYEQVKKIYSQIDDINNRLELIKNTKVKPESGWDYLETDPSLIDIIEFIKNISFCEYKDKFSKEVNDIRNETLNAWLEKNLNITKNSSLYKTMDYLFNNIYSECNEFSMSDYSYVMQLCNVNMRQFVLGRYKEIGKKYNSEYSIWEYDSLNVDFLKDKFKNNIYLKELLSDIIEINEHPEKIKSIKR